MLLTFTTRPASRPFFTDRPINLTHHVHIRGFCRRQTGTNDVFCVGGGFNYGTRYNYYCHCSLVIVFFFFLIYFRNLCSFVTVLSEMYLLTTLSLCWGADKSLARPGRKRFTGHLQPRRNWTTWASSVLITHPILRIWPRQNTTCFLDWKKKRNWKRSISG
jgi:hypothetical protein